ncbi:MAG TPA: sigma-70 family RNA polymerase sigma factor [Bryobacteraceae bacterium]|jgi:RNA polymerase sigma-70 factor (ECF subfamily)
MASFEVMQATQQKQKYFEGQAEEELVAAAQAGSQEAFAELLRRCRPRLTRVAWSILGILEEVEDAVQNASWKAYQHLAAFRREASFNSWVTRIVVNQARMRLRELRRAKLVAIDEPAEGHLSPAGYLAENSPDPESMYAGEEMLEALYREIRLLPTCFRQILLLHVENGSVPETAEELNVSLSAAKTRLLRARQQLTVRMRRYRDARGVAA